MRIALGSDEATHLTDHVAAELTRRGHDIVPAGALAPGDDPRWPAVGRKVGVMVASGACTEGILFCFTGTGVSMAANKVPGVRAALCGDAQTAAGARRWNHANVLVMSLRATSVEEASKMLESWFTEPFGTGDDQEMVDLLADADTASADPAG
jgi:ribose 5-phosphate isomerase B